jgi:hypothetical protein
MLRRLLVAGSLLGCVTACASPTLPLPPPEEPTIGPGLDADHIRLRVGCGGAVGGAVIVILNTNTAVPGDEAVSGAVASDCGAWDATAYAHNGDFLDITQDLGNERSQSLLIEVNVQ